MIRTLLIPLMVVGIVMAGVAEPQKQEPKGVPEPYAGKWICQTSMPGYNILLPSADPSQPQTNKTTTPPTVMLLKFSLKADGSYESADGKGHYSYNDTTKSITWLDGPHEKKMTKTQLSKRDNNAVKIGLVFNRRYYGCFMPKAEPR